MKRVLSALLVLAWCLPAVAASDLMAVYVQALDHNPDYQAVVAAYQQSQEARPQALAKLLPQVAAGGAVGRIEQSVSGQFFLGQPLINRGDGISSNRDDYFNRYGYAVGLTQAVFHWDLFLGLSQSDLKVAAADLALMDAQNQLRLGVAEAYFGVLAARSQERLARAENDAIEQLATQTGDRFKAGLVSDADDEQAQAAANEARATLIAATTQVQVAQAQLAMVAGQDFAGLKDLSSDVMLPAPTPDDAKSWVDHARTQNLEVGIGRLRTRIAQYEVRMKEALHLPTLDALASREYDYANGGITSGIGAGNNHALDQRLMLKLKVPIYSGGAVDSAVRAARAALRRSRALEDASVGKAVRDATIDFLKAEAGRARIAALRQSVTSAQAAEASAKVGYQVGTQTYVDVLNAIQQRYKSESEFAQARYDYLIDTLKLKNAAGSLSADDLQRINQWLD